MRGFLFVCAIVLLLSLSTSVMAQQTATVNGIVTDVTGAVIPGVEITATNKNTGIATVRISGEGGSYTIPALQSGPYTIVASLSGFSDASIEVNLTPNQIFRFNFKLQVGTVATTVEVVSDADALLATTTSSVGDALPEREVLSLPLATRDVFDLLDTTAGLVRAQDGDATNFAGTRVSAVNTTRDGLTVSDGRYLDWNGAYSATYSSPDLVQEVQVSVGTVDAEAGRGSSQVRLQTRSGTNAFHGALFYTTNNSALNATTWFDNLRGRRKDWTNRNQFGGRLGGPIIRNKAFFFVLVDEQRFLTRNNVTGTVWTPQARQGIFRYWPGAENQNYLAGPGRRSIDTVGNPLRPDAATGDLRSINLFSDVRDPFRTAISNNAYIRETLRRMPVPNDFTVGDGLNTAGINWVRRQSGIDNAAGTSQDTNRNQLNLRFDYQLTANNRINFVTSREHNFNDAAQPSWPGGFKGVSTRDPQILSAQWTATISPTVLNEFRFGRRISSWHGRGPYEVGCCFGDAGRLDNLSESAKEAQTFIPKVAGSGYPYFPALATLGGETSPWLGVRGGSRSQTSPLWQFADNFSWVKGKHSFKAGWEGTWSDSNGWNTGGLWPGATMGNGGVPIRGIRGVFGGLATADATRAEGILNDLAGSVGSQVQTYIVNDPKRGFDDILVTIQQNLNFHQDDWAAYLKDNWNATQNLTLNWGVRYDAYGVTYEGKGLAPVSSTGELAGISGPSRQLTTLITVGKNSLNPHKQVHKRDWNNFAPQLGFSYKVPWLNRTTVVRGGYGVSYSGAPTLLQYDFSVGRNPGKTSDSSLVPTTYTPIDSVQFPLPLTIQPFGTVPLTDRRNDVFGYEQNRTIPYIQNFNLSIETELARNTNLSVAWLGTKGSQLYGGRDLNEPDIFGNGILEAFNITREGGNASLFDSMFRGLNFGTGTCGLINGTTCTASRALRQWTQTDDFFANGEAAGFAEFISQTNQGATGTRFAGQYGGLLRANGYPENFIVTNPQFDNVLLYGNNDNSTYHAMQTQVTRRYASGYSGQFTYTWSRALGNAGAPDFRARQDQAVGYRDYRNGSLQKGLQTFHRTHQINAHGIWDLPFGPSRLLGSSAPSWVHRIIEGWQLSSIFSWASGQPNSIFARGGDAGDAGFILNSLQTLVGEQPINTPDLVGNFPKSAGKVTVGDGVVRYLDGYTRVAEPVTSYYGSNPDRLERFANLWQLVDGSGNVVLRSPKPGTTGSLPTTWFEGPSVLRVDAALSKSVQIREGMKFTVRMDAINMLNTPQWGNPNTNLFSPNFGRITSAGGARRFTFNARVDF